MNYDNSSEVFDAPLGKFQREFLEETRLDARDALSAIIAAYDKAKEDPATKIPTILMCAIEVARRKL